MKTSFNHETHLGRESRRHQVNRAEREAHAFHDISISRKSSRSIARFMLFAGIVCIMPTLATAQLVIPGADGSDGSFSPVGTNFVVDLSQATTANWDAPSPTVGKGVYDPTKWAVVFKYSSVNIPSGTTVRFLNHPKGAPVVWLVSGDVTINGTVNLNGENGKLTGSLATEPGPGGFRGGIGSETTQRFGSAGFGPGGGQIVSPNNLPVTGAGSYSSHGDGYSPGLIYGNSQILPLIGGSGGAGNEYLSGHSSGGAGGGAILVAASGIVSIAGAIVANGGTYSPINYGGSGGSGGAIRIVANRVAGTGTVEARSPGTGGNTVAPGGNGRVRIEAVNFANGLNIFPSTVAVAPANPPLLWTPAGTPELRVISVTGVPVPADPASNLGVAGADVILTNATNVVIEVQAANVALNGLVTLRIVPKSGLAVSTNAMFVSGDINASVWRVQTTIPKGFCAIQARAVTP